MGENEYRRSLLQTVALSSSEEGSLLCDWADVHPCYRPSWASNLCVWPGGGTTRPDENQSLSGGERTSLNMDMVRVGKVSGRGEGGKSLPWKGLGGVQDRAFSARMCGPCTKWVGPLLFRLPLPAHINERWEGRSGRGPFGGAVEAQRLGPARRHQERVAKRTSPLNVHRERGTDASADWQPF